MNISFLKEKGNKYLIYILVGLLAVILLIPTGKEEKQEITVTENDSFRNLESQLESVLSAMEGVGKVKVMITTEEIGDSLFQDKSREGKVCGVVVVAEGAGNASVNAKISEAVKALFSVEVHKISIVKMKSQEENR